MASRNSRAVADGASGAAAGALNTLSELPRRQLAAMSQSAAAVFRGSQAIRQLQQDAAQRAFARQQQVTQRLLQPLPPAELVQLQSDLLRFYIQEGMQYWQQVTTATLKTQQELTAGVSEVLDTDPEPSLDALQRVFEASLDSNGTAAAPH